MQRIYSTFPNSWPGAGILVLRLAVGVPLILSCVAALHDADGLSASAILVLGVIVGSMLVLGLWTPFAAFSLVLACTWLIASGGSFEHLVPLLTSLSLVMLGPGAWSVDARLFGRKRISMV